MVAGAAEAAAATATETATPNAAATDASNSQVEQVVVTARRRSENIEKVPVAVQAFSQKALTQNSITDPYRLSTLVPGLTVDSASGNTEQPSFAIRGRGQIYGTSAGSVETYFADVPLSAPFQIPTLPPQFFDVQSFQVLKGPQGTLFGRSTTGGAVVIVPAAPTNDLGGYARIQGGTYNDFQFEGALNVPIVQDKALFRFAMFDWQRAGYMHTYPGTPNDLTGVPMGSQTYDNVDTTELRASLLLRPTDNLTNTTIFTYHTDKTRSSGGSGLMLNGYYATVPGYAFGQTAPEPGYGTRYTGTGVDLTKPATNVYAVINTTTYDFNPNLLVKNIFGYINAEGFTDDAADSDGLATTAAIDLPVVPFRPRRNEQFTDEVQFQGKSFGDRLSWIVGGLYDQTLEPGVSDLDLNSETFSLSASATGGPGSVLVARMEQNNILSFGAYLSGTFKITDQLNISAGYRHSWYSIDYLDGCGTAIAPTFAVTPNGGAACGGIALVKYPTLNTGGDTYNVGLDYHPTGDAMIYGGYRRGYKHGGFNPSDTDISTAAFGPETVDDFYIGLKDQFRVFDRHAQFNIEGYYDLYDGYQAAYLGFTDGNLITTTLNIPKSTFSGFETDLALDATDWLYVSLNYGYIDARVTKWSTDAGGVFVDLSKNPMAYVSPNKFSATFRLHGELPGDRGELALAPTVSYQDRFFTTAFEIAAPANGIPTGAYPNMEAAGGGIVPGYTTVDLRAEWNHLMGSKVDAALNVTNLTDKLYFTGNSGTLNYGVQANAYGPPRMFTLELSTRF